MFSLHSTTRLVTGILLAAGVALVSATPALAQAPEVKFKEYADGYAFFSYPEQCSITWKGGSGRHWTSSETFVDPGTITVSCPPIEGISEYEFEYGSGAGSTVDDFRKTGLRADGTKYTFAIKYAPHARDTTMGIPFCSYWTNARITPVEVG